MSSQRVARVIGLLATLVLLSSCYLIEISTSRPVDQVIVVGDSVMSFETPYLQSAFGTRAEVQFVGALSSGPLSSQKRWADQLREKLSTFPADLVIFESCCHYEGTIDGQPGPLYVNDDGVTVQPDTELMYTELAAAEAELVQIARDAGASPYWVKLPPGNANTDFYGPTFRTRIDRFNAIVDNLGVPVLDWGAAVTSQPNVDELRYPDGVHYWGPGYEFLATFTLSSTVKLAG